MPAPPGSGEFWFEPRAGEEPDTDVDLKDESTTLLSEDAMARKLAYWISTALVALALLGSLSYLTGSEEVVSGFAKAGYPQHLRIVLGVVKPSAAIVLLVPGLALLKEWAYAGVTFALVMAFISAYLGADPVWPMPLLLLALLSVSYVTRPANRRVSPVAAGA